MEMKDASTYPLRKGNTPKIYIHPLSTSKKASCSQSNQLQHQKPILLHLQVLFSIGANSSALSILTPFAPKLSASLTKSGFENSTPKLLLNFILAFQSIDPYFESLKITTAKLHPSLLAVSSSWTYQIISSGASSENSYHL